MFYYCFLTIKNLKKSITAIGRGRQDGDWYTNRPIQYK